MADFSKPEELRARFAELGGMRDSIIDHSGPLRDQRDAIAQKAAADMKPIDDQIRKIEKDLFDINQEAALIARALGGRTGE